MSTFCCLASKMWYVRFWKKKKINRNEGSLIKKSTCKQLKSFKSRSLISTEKLNKFMISIYLSMKIINKRERNPIKLGYGANNA